MQNVYFCSHLCSMTSKTEKIYKIYRKRKHVISLFSANIIITIRYVNNKIGIVQYLHVGIFKLKYYLCIRNKDLSLKRLNLELWHTLLQTAA